MPVTSSGRFQVGPPPAQFERAALQLAFQSLHEAQRESLAAETLASVARGEQSLDGLVAAWQASRLLGALWSETQPGNTASIWPPQATAEAPPTLPDELLSYALDRLAAQDVEMVQSLLFTDAGSDAECFRRAGFDHCCDLLYLASSRAQFPTGPTAAKLQFRPVVPSELDTLAKLVEATYEQTLDCPALNGRRDCGQVLAGYQASCRDDLTNWFAVEHNGQSIGCLLLAHRAGSTSWELIYMGLLSAARGSGLGIEIVRHAQWLVGEQGGEHLLLAVDAANSPAMRHYAAAGFVTWDRRSVFLKFLPSSGSRSA